MILWLLFISLTISDSHHECTSMCLLVQICNAVAVAKLMNSTLIIPHFHFNSVWKDPRLVPVILWIYKDCLVFVTGP